MANEELAKLRQDFDDALRILIAELDADTADVVKEAARASGHSVATVLDVLDSLGIDPKGLASGRQ